ncbi:MAG: peptidylprolyl isomerase [Bacteroidales bacterium]|nr:peptidylprolyl isomerase [Bacteroidales bacterium]
MHKIGRKIAVIASVFSCFSLVAQEADPVIMTVNGKKILKSEFEYIYNKNNPATSSDRKSLDEYVAMFVKFRLKVAAAEAEGLDTVSTFRNELDGYRRQLIEPYLTDKKAEDNLFQEAYNRMKENVEASYIYINIPEPGTSSDTLAAYKKALSIREKALKKNADFNQLAVEYSEDPTAKKNRGYLGYIPIFNAPYEFETLVYTMQPGEISMPSKFQQGYFIIKVTNRRPDQGEFLASHILKLVSKDADSQTQTAAEQKIKDIYQKLKDGGDFAAIAKQESDDKGTAVKGGELPWFGTGRMTKQFEEAVFAMQKGELSQPFRSEYGWHIVLLKDKRSLPPYEEKKKELLEKIRSNSRQNLATVAFVEKLKAEYSFTFNPTSYQSLYLMADHGFPFDSLFVAEMKTKNGDLFQFAGETFTIKDFADYVSKNSQTRALLALDAMKEKLQEFEVYSVLDYENKHLETKYPEFGHLMQEYRDGILLFEISNREVWEKATKEKEKIQSFFEKNKNKYKWEKPHYKGYIVQCKDSKVAKAAKKLIKKLPADSIQSVLTREFNKNGKSQIKFNKGLFEKGTNPFVDKLAYKTGEMKVDSLFPVVFLSGKNLKYTPQSYEDVRGEITSDYQNYLEEEWVKSLKQRFKVEINEEVLRSVQK